MLNRNAFLFIFVLLCLSSGCVRRRMTIRSDPPGAKVYVDDQEIGITPVSTKFTYYGTRKIKLVRPGFETLNALEKIAPPWYQIPPLDFISENFYPGELRDERILEFELEPQRIVPKAELVDRGDELRNATMAGYTVPSVPRDLGQPATEPGQEFSDDLPFPENSNLPPAYFPE